MTLPSPTTPAYWLEAFNKVERLDSLKTLFALWWQDYRARMSAADRLQVIRAKDRRKAALAAKARAA